MDNNKMTKREMDSEAYFRLSQIVYRIFHHVWHMPKSVRDNYRMIEPVNYTPYMGRERENKADEAK